MRLEQASLSSTELPAPPPGVRDGVIPATPARPPIILRRRIEAETVSPLRRRQLSWRRKPRLWRWTKRIAGLLAVIAAPAAAIVWLFTSQHFALRETAVVIGGLDAEPSAGGRRREIRSTDAPRRPSRVSEAWVRQQLEPFLGDNLLRLPLAAVAEPIERHPWVRAVDLGKELPASLRVRVAERREAAILRHGEGGPSSRLTYLDREGRPIAPLDPAEAAAVIETGEWVIVSRRVSPAAAPQVETPDPELGAALDLLRELEAAAPRWITGLSEIEILGEQDFKVITTGLPFPLVVQAGTIKDRIRRLEDHLPQLEERYGAEAVIDLRFERRIIVEPSPRGPAVREPAATAPAVADPGETQQKGDSG